MLPGFSAKKSLHRSQYVSKRKTSGAYSSADAIIPVECSLSCYDMCLSEPGDEEFCAWACDCPYQQK
jgi:hypothetical protein